MFQQEIYEQDSWYGYRKDAMQNIFNFTAKASLIAYRTTDEKLNELITEVSKSLEDFTHYSARELYGGDDWYSPDKGTDVGRERAEKASPVMNRMTTTSFEKLKSLLAYLKDHEYV